MKTVIGLYDDIAEARDTVQELVNAGIDRDNINLIAHDEAGKYGATLQDRDGNDTQVAETAAGGAVAGGIVGGLGGVLLGLGALAIPGLGPVIAAGPIVAGLIGAGVGAATGGVIGAMVGWGISEEEAGYYAEGIRRGGTVVAVQVEDRIADDVKAIMNRFNPVNLEKRSEYWQSQGWQGYDAKAEPYTADQIDRDRSAYADFDKQYTGEGEKVIPIVEEELHVGKRVVNHGGARIHTYVEEQPVSEDIRLRQERVRVEQRSADRPATAADIDAFEEGTFEVSEMSEEAVAEKRARVVSEVVIDKDVQERTETISDTVRRTEVDVDQRDMADHPRFETYRPTFRRSYQNQYADTGYTYEQAEPAYRYGYNLALNDRYRDQDWKELEPEARRHWEQRNQGTWDRFKHMVREGWQETQNAI